MTAPISDTTVFRNYFSGAGVSHPPYSGRGAEVTGTTDVLIQGNRCEGIRAQCLMAEGPDDEGGSGEG